MALAFETFSVFFFFFGHFVSQQGNYVKNKCDCKPDTYECLIKFKGFGFQFLKLKK